jgi:hypothetical protein
VQWLIVDDDVGQFLSSVFANNAHEKQLVELFPDGSVVGPLYHSLINPANTIWQELPDLLKTFTLTTIDPPIKLSLFASNADENSRKLIETCLLDIRKDEPVATYFSQDISIDDLATVFPVPDYFITSGTPIFADQESVVDRYGRFLADIFVTMHSDVLVFDEGSEYGWLAHAVRAKHSIMLHNGRLTDLPAVDFPPQPDTLCTTFL